MLVDACFFISGLSGAPDGHHQTRLDELVWKRELSCKTDAYNEPTLAPAARKTIRSCHFDLATISPLSEHPLHICCCLGELNQVDKQPAIFYAAPEMEFRLSVDPFVGKLLSTGKSIYVKIILFTHMFVN